MRRIVWKRVLGALVAAVMALGCLPLAFAAQEKVTPVIVVPGMGSALYQNAGTDQQKEIWPLAFDDSFMAKLNPLINDLLALLGDPTGDLQPLVDKVLPIVKEMVEPLACNPDGTSKDQTVDVGFHWTDSMANHLDYLDGTQGEPGLTRALCDEIGPENVYLFMYDWRLDVTEHAQALRKMVEQVKTEKGTERVSIVSGSMGTSIAAAYLEAYGADDLESCIFLSPAFQGVSLVGELFQKNIVLDKKVVMRFFNSMELPEEVAGAINSVDSLGLLDTAFQLLNRLLDTYKDTIYDEILIPVFATMPGFWDVAPASYYDGAIEALQVKNETMLHRIETYRSAQVNLAENLKKAQEGGTYVAVVAHYGLYGVPLTALPNVMTDNLIDTTYASGGAVCASVKGTLGADYAQKVEDGHPHLSIDGQIDASTCILPDTTWFLKGSMHMQYLYDTDSMDLLVWLITAKDHPTVFDQEKFPQFLQFHADGSLTPVVKEEKPPVTPQPENPAPSEAPSEAPSQDDGSKQPEKNPGTGDAAAAGMLLLLAAAGGTALLLKKKQF